MKPVKTTLNCAMCGEVLNEESPPSLGAIIRNCGDNTAPHIQARKIMSIYKLPDDLLLCDDCFWMFGKKHKEKSLALPILALWFAIAMFGISIFIFMNGWHGLDLAQDITQLMLRAGVNPDSVTEMSLNGVSHSLPETYLVGAFRMFKGFFLSMLSVLTIMFSILWLIDRVRAER